MCLQYNFDNLLLCSVFSILIHINNGIFQFSSLCHSVKHLIRYVFGCKHVNRFIKLDNQFASFFNYVFSISKFVKDQENSWKSHRSLFLLFVGTLHWNFVFFRLVSYDILIWCLIQHICHLQRHFNDITVQQNNISL